jgi:hypothetical protein
VELRSTVRYPGPLAVAHVGQFKFKKCSPLSFDIDAMPVHESVLGPWIATLVTMSKHSSITDDPMVKNVSVIVRIPVACVIVNDRYPPSSA